MCSAFLEVISKPFASLSREKDYEVPCLPVTDNLIPSPLSNDTALHFQVFK